jgi:hypothetical protein
MKRQDIYKAQVIQVLSAIQFKADKFLANQLF